MARSGCDYCIINSFHINGNRYGNEYKYRLAMDDINDSTFRRKFRNIRLASANGRCINRTNLRSTLVVQSHIRLMRVNMFSFKFICCWVLIQFVWSSFYGERVRACLCHEIYRLHEKSILIILHFTRFFLFSSTCSCSSLPRIECDSEDHQSVFDWIAAALAEAENRKKLF